MKLIRLLLIVALALPNASFAGPKKDPDETTYHEISLVSFSKPSQGVEEDPTEKTNLVSHTNDLLLGWDEESDCYDGQSLTTGQKIGCCVATIYMTTAFALGFFFIYLGVFSH